MATYWVSGAGSGIGKAIASLLAAQGHRVLISGRREQPLQELAAQAPDRLLPLPCDIANDEQMASLFSTLEIKVLDGVFHCAGTCEYIDLPDFNPAACRRVFDTNIMGTVNVCAAAWPLLAKADKPFIAGLCSMSSYLGFPRAEAYGASKAAMSYYLQSLRADLGQHLDVIEVYLGFVETPMTAQNDFAMPFLQDADTAARYIIGRTQAGKRPRKVVFPYSLHSVLAFFRRFPALWYGLMIPRLRRQSKGADQ